MDRKRSPRGVHFGSLVVCLDCGDYGFGEDWFGHGGLQDFTFDRDGNVVRSMIETGGYELMPVG